MRVPLLLLAATLALAGCKNNDAADTTKNYDENLTAENIVSNDVTAIDAVTGDAANMAADVDLNYGNVDENAASPASNAPEPTPTRTKAKASRDTTSTPAPEPATNAATSTPPPGNSE